MGGFSRGNAQLSFSGRMLHFVQHDRHDMRYFIASGSKNRAAISGHRLGVRDELLTSPEYHGGSLPLNT